MNAPLPTTEPTPTRSASVNRHATDVVSLVFGLAFLMIAAWWLVAELIDLDLDLPDGGGWLVAAALITFGVLGVTASLRGGRRADRAPVATAVPPPPPAAETVSPAAPGPVSPAFPPPPAWEPAAAADPVTAPDPVAVEEPVTATDPVTAEEPVTAEARTGFEPTDDTRTGLEPTDADPDADAGETTTRPGTGG
jgi:hypothetical protein